MARPSKSKAIERLREVLDKIPELKQLWMEKQLWIDSPKFERWKREAEVAIAYTFDKNSPYVRDFDKSLMSIILSNLRGWDSAESVLESMIDEIKKHWEEENLMPPSSASREEERTKTNEVFVIHGRDNEAKETVARFLTKLALTPVILHEQPNQGRTIIEKFEQNAQVGFAVALLTPDDVGSLKNDEKNLKPRARQNVVFELGYFLGRLGRERVCALTKGNVELPSDYDGVVYISLDDGGWKMDLIRELKNVGFEVDANRAL